MSIEAILIPMFAQVALTFVLLFWMSVLRLRAVRSGAVQAQQIALREPNRLFMLKLPSNPPASPDFGPWQRVDSIDDTPGQEPRKAGDGDDYQVRYRVKRAD